MKQSIKLFLAGIVAMIAMSFPVRAPTTVQAVDPFAACGTDASSSVCKAKNTDNVFVILRNVISILLVIIGAVTVIMIIVGGIKYVTSSGDQSQLTSAKNTILYAVIGLVIAIMSYAIVNFVIGSI